MSAPSTRPASLVLGGAGAVGSALARRLAARGDQVWVAGRTESTLRPLAEEIGGRAQVLDGSDFEAVGEWVRAAKAEAGRIRCLANCAGSILLKPADRTSRDEWDAVLRANLDTALAFLLDDASGWITGQVLGVDGGLSRLRGRARAGG